MGYKMCMDENEDEEVLEAVQEELGLPGGALSGEGQGEAAEVSHAGELSRLNRIRGQIAGVRRMIDRGRDSMEILIQLKAARAAIKRVEARILQRHMSSCIDAAFGGSREEAEQKMEELRDYFDAN